MNTNHKKGRLRALFAAALVITGAGLAITSSPVAAVDIVTGANATKSCPDQPFGLGDDIPCLSTFTNTGNAPATVLQLTEQSPWPGGPTVPLTCTIPGGQTISTGSTLNPGAVCAVPFIVHVPNDPALCNTFLLDRVEIALSYPRPAPQTPLAAGANATNTTFIQCLPSITVDKVADTTSKVTDPVHYTITICNTSQIAVTRTSVVDTLVGDIASNFPATLAPGACATYAYDRVVQAGDPDQLMNTVTAAYSGGVPVTAATATDTALTNLFQPGVNVTKSCGPNPAQVGQTETCSITVTNTSSADAPGLVNGSIMDSLTGNLIAVNPAVTASTCGPALPTGASCSITTARVILASDPNPVVNTVTVHYNPAGFPNDITSSATASVATVVPSISVTKSADSISKPGDPVTYSITICNTGPLDVAPNVVTDSLQGNITALFGPLASTNPDTCQTVSYQRTVQPGDPDPLINTVDATYGTQFQAATASASATTNLFQPGVTVDKNCGPSPLQVGQTETCTIVVTNTSSADAPNLVNGTIVDSLNGNLLAVGNSAVTGNTCQFVLPTGASCGINTSRVVLAGDASPLVNTVVVHYNPEGFPNDITDSDSAQVIIIRPAITLNITATPLSKATDAVTYVITVCNSGDIPLSRDSVNATVLGNGLAGFADTLNVGGCSTVTITRTVLASDPDPLVVNATASYSGQGATATATSSATTNLFQPGVDVTKTCAPDPINVGQSLVCTIHVTNTSSADSPALTQGTINDSLYGNLLLAGNTAVTSNTCTTSLAVGASCEITTSKVVASATPNPLVNTVTVLYHPAGFPNNITDSATASVVVKAPVTQQCTLGFWKQDQHFWAWKGYTPNQSFNTVFGTNITLNAQGKTPAISNPTLLQALNAGGGGINDLARHAVAALLNSSSLQNPTYTVAQVINSVKAAYAAGGAAITNLAAQFDAEQQADRCTGFLNSPPK